MVNTADCKSIVSAFERRGMEFQEQRPHTAMPGSSRPPTASAGPECLDQGHATAQPVLRTTTVPQPIPFTHQQPATSGVSQIPSSPAQFPIPSHGPSQRLIHPPLLRRDELSTPREIVSGQPNVTQVFRSSTMPSQALDHVVHGLPLGTADHTRERPSSTSHISTLEAIRKQVEDEVRSLQTSMLPPSLQPSYSSEKSSSSALTTANNTLLSSSLSEVRPQTACLSTASSSVPPDSQEFDIPPRRELPFKRPDSKCKNNEHGLRPISSTFMMPALPKTRPMKDGSGSAFRALLTPLTKDIPSFQSGATSPLKRSFNKVDSERSRPRTMDEMTVTKAGGHLASPLRDPSPATITTAESLPRPSTKPEELLCSHNRLPILSNNVQTIPRISSLVDMPHEITDSPPTSPPKASGTVFNDNPTNRAFSAIRAAVNDPGVVSVDEYATQSMQDRQAALEEFMIANLENPAFTKLCEDLENCWRRIALGL